MSELPLRRSVNAMAPPPPKGEMGVGVGVTGGGLVGVIVGMGVRVDSDTTCGTSFSTICTGGADKARIANTRMMTTLATKTTPSRRT